MEKMIFKKDVEGKKILGFKENPFNEDNILIASEIVLLPTSKIKTILSFILGQLEFYEEHFDEPNLERLTAIENIRGIRMLVLNKSLGEQKTQTISEIVEMSKEKVEDIINFIMNRLTLYESKYHKKI